MGVVAHMSGRRAMLKWTSSWHCGTESREGATTAFPNCHELFSGRLAGTIVAGGDWNAPLPAVVDRFKLRVDGLVGQLATSAFNLVLAL
eukprot:4308427-Amphidinium_carterae.1